MAKDSSYLVRDDASIITGTSVLIAIPEGNINSYLFGSGYQEMSFWKQFTSLVFISAAIFTSYMLLRINFYIGTVNDQLSAMASTPDRKFRTHKYNYVYGFININILCFMFFYLCRGCIVHDYLWVGLAFWWHSFCASGRLVD